eukprot:COSAG01_NODE_42446_length_441_cov_0.630499_1_plen_77_part_01
MLIDSRTIYAAKLNLRVPVRLQAKKCPLLANIYCTALRVTLPSRFLLQGPGFQGFFQAEDGLRDSPDVTGVQTCALP